MTSTHRSCSLILGGCLALALLAHPGRVSGQDRLSLQAGAGPVARGVSADVGGAHGFAAVSVSLAPAVALRGSTFLAVGKFARDFERAELESMAKFDLAAVFRWVRSGPEPYVAFGLGYSTRNVGDDLIVRRRFGTTMTLGIDTGSENGGWFAEVSPRYEAQPLLFLTIGRVW